MWQSAHCRWPRTMGCACRLNMRMQGRERTADHVVRAPWQKSDRPWGPCTCTGLFRWPSPSCSAPFPCVHLTDEIIARLFSTMFVQAASQPATTGETAAASCRAPPGQRGRRQQGDAGRSARLCAATRSSKSPTFPGHLKHEAGGSFSRLEAARVRLFTLDNTVIADRKSVV